MIYNHMSLTYFEQQVMGKILAGNNPALIILREQLKLCRIEVREFTGVGFYVEFTLPKNVPCVRGCPSFEINDVIGDISGISNGVGFVLYVRDGRLNVLEGFTYDEVWPEQISNFHLNYSKEVRDIDGFQTNNAAE